MKEVTDIVVIAASTREEREAIYRLRYQVYVEEMHNFESIADHDKKSLSDPYDETARLFYASVDGEVVGTCRLHWGGDAPFPEEFDATYNMRRFQPSITTTQMTVASRLAVKPAYRGTLIPFQLIVAVVGFQSDPVAELCFCDCQPHLINLYERLGFRSYARTYDDSHYGVMVPLVLIRRDVERLRSIGSPLLPHLAELPQDTALLSSLRALIGQAASVRGPASGAEYWSEIFALVSHSRRNKASVFEGFTEHEFQDLLAKSHLFECARGDCIMRKGQTTRTMFVVLEGSVEVRGQGGFLAAMSDGDVFGEVAFLLSATRTSDVFASSDRVKLLSLDEQQMRKLIDTESRIAAKLLLNMARAIALKLVERSSWGSAGASVKINRTT